MTTSDGSSSDLSARLRGSGSFYMDLDKGIDSDIAMECGGPVGDLASVDCDRDGTDLDQAGLTTDSDSDRAESETTTRWVNMTPAQGDTSSRMLLPPMRSSPINRARIIPTPDRQPPPAHPPPVNPLNNGHANHIHTVHENGGQSVRKGSMTMRLSGNPLEITEDHETPPATPQSVITPDEDDLYDKKLSAVGHTNEYSDSFIVVLSAMYAKLIVVMGTGFPLAEVISPKIPPSFFVAFYLYLYLGSILFLIYAYSYLLSQRKFKTVPNHLASMLNHYNSGHKHPREDASIGDTSLLRRKRVDEAGLHCGSFYLRMGAVAFGIGSMIYSGLEFGQFFELDPSSQCYSVLTALTPCVQMAFTFIQLYFIFLNSKMCIYKYKTLARFGLMHMVATNLCVWLYVLVQESKHEILTYLDPNHHNFAGVHATLPPISQHMGQSHFHHNDLENKTVLVIPVTNFTNTLGHHHHIEEEPLHHLVKRGLRYPPSVIECRRINIMGQLVQDASPFLFPCTIEYSLICAAILYIMWKNIGLSDKSVRTTLRQRSNDSEISNGTGVINARRHLYSVDCAHAHKGLFTGILVLVLAIISLIVFFVLVGKKQYYEIAVLEAHVAELVLYSLTTIASFIALIQVRQLRYYPQSWAELDNILLVVAQTGVYLFAIFCVIGGHFTMDNSTALTLLAALGNLIQATVQTVFILDASSRSASTPEQARKKPGREMVTFLLVCNFAMWAINSLESRRADANPVQLNFYGFWAWTIIAHISTPLAIFFRFHSTVCLCEIWKKLYKIKPEML